MATSPREPIPTVWTRTPRAAARAAATSGGIAPAGLPAGAAAPPPRRPRLDLFQRRGEEAAVARERTLGEDGLAEDDEPHAVAVGHAVEREALHHLARQLEARAPLAAEPRAP